MEMFLIWCLAYAIVRAAGDTAVNLASLLRGRPVTVHTRRPRSTSAGQSGDKPAPGRPVRPSYTGRALGTLARAVKESFVEGWRTGWSNGRTARYAGQGWRPWRQPHPPAEDMPVGDPPTPGAGIPRATPPPASSDPGPAAGGPAPRPAGGTTEAPTVDPVDPVGDKPAQPGRSGRPAGGDDEIVDAEVVTPRCWSDLDIDEQHQVVAAARDRYGRAWDDLTVDQCAGVVRDWINTRYRVDLHEIDVFDAQRGRDDPTWLTGPPDPGPAPTAGPAHDPATAVTGPSTPEGAPMTTTSGETTNIANARAYYTSLEKHATDDVAGQIELSKSYLTVAQMSDETVLGAITRAEEAARLLATAAAGVGAALEAHRLMEEAVASTPGAANTDFYKKG
ncbi:hypothetical protein FsymDg_1278 [Candidatus Protofrankia datiscae]|uniref:Uncharacterized protein n=1 Tax=Candidatus Protofrankia datiscae TaxID=2716812 RepID=F8B0D7_9ACTN|nr:hypothetical protein [Candidatus Protofrankia datiscae]AEH08763.1 hypothetical protein FsymDg_1278 [Candidatus Protofrankia datiscae]